MKHFLSLSILLLITARLFAQLSGPVVSTRAVCDTFFGTPVEDRYRWMENLSGEKTIGWLHEQKQTAGKFLRKASAKCNSYVAIDEYSFVQYNDPQKQRDYYFFYAYRDNVSEPALFYQHSLNDEPQILVDPVFISKGDRVLPKGHAISGDSRLLAFQYSKNGSDLGEIRVVNMKTGNLRDDHLTHVKFSNIAWKDDGFYYSAFPDQGFESSSGQKICYHKIGTGQSEDAVVFKRDQNPEAFFTCFTTSDERFLIIKETDKKKGEVNIFYIDFESPLPALRPLITRLGLDENLEIIDNAGSKLIAITFKDVNNGMVIAIDPSRPRQWEIIIPEFEKSLLLEAKLLEQKIITTYLSDQKEHITFFDLNGNSLYALELPFGFSASGFNGEKTDKKLLFSYSGYTQPPVVYILDTDDYNIKPLKATVVNFDFTRFVTKELEYPSADGTTVSLFLVHDKNIDLTLPHKLLLKAYGGFGSISVPYFQPGLVHFLKSGGIFAFANIRGGGDKGKDWALQGRGPAKQKSFDDFISAAEFLIREGYTSPQLLAITGASNGGLVVGAAMTQRPELFAVAVPVVAPLDMIRFENFTVGHYHLDEYGTVTDSAGFFNLLSYSPYHNIKPDINYPATMIMTSSHDDRVPPFHSYKFAAALQNRDAQLNPVVLRVEEDAGHYGAMGSIKSGLREEAALYDFILYCLDEK
ncbi:MAG: prolyl oligopeptidase family serine peptidase [Bacteroidales bacterium]